MKKLAIILLFCVPLSLFSQGMKPKPNFSGQQIEKVELNINDQLSNIKPKTNSYPGFQPHTLNWNTPSTPGSEKNSMVFLIANPEKINGLDQQAKIDLLLLEVREQKGIENEHYGFINLEKSSSVTGEHFSWQQSYKGIPVFGSELKIHSASDENLWAMGRLQKIEKEISVSAELSEEQALEKLKEELSSILNWQELSPAQLRFVPNARQFQAKLIVYQDELNEAQLAWHFSVHPNLRHRWEVFVNAINGNVIHHFASHCQLWSGTGDSVHTHCHESPATPAATSSEMLPGPVTANALDLFNITRNINVWQEGSTFYMIDGSRAMFNSGASDFPDSPEGVIWTLDAQNNSPENANFSVSHVGNNNNIWGDKVSVSAHYNGGVAYEYFRLTHNRNSINGSGGNVISLINVTEPDGSGMDNAFWNGQAMFYGNGAQAFNAPLAKGLDVAGHEISHGVIQNEANLVYQNQPGALNESFADIFGAMIDRDDWQIGEDISNPSVFPSGQMRDMEDPHNGGTSNNFYWQPKHMDEFVNLPNTQQGDWGGVHINSGIPNHAFFLFATSNVADVGKDRAEKVYYEVLANHLVSSSEFIDLRIAVVEVANAMYGPSVKAAAELAFQQVGIGDGPGNNHQQDDPVNPGDEIILWADGFEIGFFFADNSFKSISTTNQGSRPSITDDGTRIVFIDDQNRIKVIDVDYANGTEEEYFLENTPQTIWRNIAISKDGSKLSLLTTDEDNELLIYDFVGQNLVAYELENPTTSNPGTGQTTNTGDVRYADVMEWDITGEFVMYDAFNELSSTWSGDISYWDIGLIRVWNNAGNDFADGAITKLFNGLGESESIGNPTWSKNSAFIIAFDYITTDFFGQNEYEILGANLETGNTGTIFENATLGYPSFSPKDDALLFSALNTNNEDILATIPLASNKISAGGNAGGIIGGVIWGLWFANGDRPLVGTEELAIKQEWSIWPNPSSSQFQINWQADTQVDQIRYTIYDLMGRSLKSGGLTGRSTLVNLEQLPAGSYWLTLRKDSAIVGSRRFIKQ